MKENKGFTQNYKINVLNDIRILPVTPSCSGNQKLNNTKITPESIRPLPKAIRKLTKRKRTPGISRIYTDTPEKERLEQIEQEKDKKKKGFKRNVFNTKLETKQNKQPKKKLRIETHSDSSSIESDALSLHDNSDEDLSDELEDIEEVHRENLNNEDFV